MQIVKVRAKKRLTQKQRTERVGMSGSLIILVELDITSAYLNYGMKCLKFWTYWKVIYLNKNDE